MRAQVLPRIPSAVEPRLDLQITTGSGREDLDVVRVPIAGARRRCEISAQVLPTIPSAVEPTPGKKLHACATTVDIYVTRIS